MIFLYVDAYMIIQLLLSDKRRPSSKHSKRHIYISRDHIARNTIITKTFNHLLCKNFWKNFHCLHWSFILFFFMWVSVCDYMKLCRMFQVHGKWLEVCNSSDQTWSSYEYRSKTCVRYWEQYVLGFSFYYVIIFHCWIMLNLCI